MQGIFAAAQHRHILSPVEKGVAGGAAAHTMAFQLCQTGDLRCSAGSAGGQDDGIGGELAHQRLDGELVGVSQAHGLGGDELHPQRSGPFDAPAFQFGTGDGRSKAVVVLDVRGAVQCAGPFGENGRFDPCAGRVQSGRHAGRAGTDDDDVGHGKPPEVFLLVYTFSRKNL